MIYPHVARIEKLERLITEYHESLLAVEVCAGLCSSDPYRGDEAALLMKAMHEAQQRLFAAVNIDHKLPWEEKDRLTS